MSTVFVVVTGYPTAGKTTLAKRLATDLGMFSLNKDTVKDALFESLGTKDRPWSQHVGMAALEVMFALAEQNLSSGVSTVIESNFDVFYHEHVLQGIIERQRPAVVQVQLTVSLAIAIERQKQRLADGIIHPGHLAGWDMERYVEYYEQSVADGKWRSMDFDGQLFENDTSDLANIEYDRIVRAIRESGNK